MLTRTQIYGRAAAGAVIGFLIVFLGAIGGLGMTGLTAFPGAAAAGLAVGIAVYVWLRVTTDRPDPMLG